jgi:hypothetical protein
MCLRMSVRMDRREIPPLGKPTPSQERRRRKSAGLLRSCPRQAGGMTGRGSLAKVEWRLSSVGMTGLKLEIRGLRLDKSGEGPTLAKNARVGHPKAFLRDC